MERKQRLLRTQRDRHGHRHDHPPAARRPWAWAAAGGAAALGAGAAAYLFNNSPHVPGTYPACFLLTLTGFYCPACGGTRAAYDLMHGDVAGSFAMNPLVPLAVIATALLLARIAYRRLRPSSNSGQRKPLSMWWPIGIGIAVLVFGVLRNVPGLEWLAPA